LDNQHLKTDLELQAHIQDWLDLDRFKSEVMAELKVSAFEDLPLSVREFIARRLNVMVAGQTVSSAEGSRAAIARYSEWSECVFRTY
jgi:hypothetical protein